MRALEIIDDIIQMLWKECGEKPKRLVVPEQIFFSAIVQLKQQNRYFVPRNFGAHKDTSDPIAEAAHVVNSYKIDFNGVDVRPE